MRTGCLLGYLQLLCLVATAQVNAPAPFGAVPTDRQLAWHALEMYVLVHFTPTTFENKEWGYGDADPSLFNPSAFDAGQIAGAVKAGGFRGLILVAKHHDGFCLWPTKTTPYNISKSPWKNGKGDMVREFEQACRKAGLSFGVYCSPWDRNNPLYGTPEYVKIYRAQLRELYSGYGKLFMSWHDGANGGDGFYGGKRETRTIDRSVYYGWDSTWAITRQMQPNAAIFSDMGWDVRWVGNEKGEASETSWATFTPMPLPGKQTIGPGEILYEHSSAGTRNGKYWIPAECDVPLRPGWFYHADQDDRIKTPGQLFDIYLKSVGRGAALDLGIAPDKRGLLHERDADVLKEFGELLKRVFRHNLSADAAIKPSATRGNDASRFGASFLADDDRFTYWATDDTVLHPEVTLEWKEPVQFDLIRLRENITLGQRVEKAVLEAWVEGAWRKLSELTSIGACRIIRLDKPVMAAKLRLRISASTVCIALSEFSVFSSGLTGQ
jgi:alpha-L-fucosidase